MSNVINNPIHIVELRYRHNGIPLDTGGYTIAIRKVGEDRYKTTLSQCPKHKKWDARWGKNAALRRMSNALWQTLTFAELEQQVQTLHQKVNSGSLLTTRVDLSEIQ